jgi:hypothetical protein
MEQNTPETEVNSEVKKRKDRSDKGVPRGPRGEGSRLSKELTPAVSSQNALENIKKLLVSLQQEIERLSETSAKLEEADAMARDLHDLSKKYQKGKKPDVSSQFDKK